MSNKGSRKQSSRPAWASSLHTFASLQGEGKRNVTLGQLANIADALDRGLDVTFPAVATEYRQRSEELGATDV